jgi:hypothetical protein
MTVPTTLPPVFTFHVAVRHGFSRHQIARRVHNGTWYSWRRGVYVDAAVFDRLPAREQHLMRVAALLLARGETDAASHLSAAAAHGWLLPLDGAGVPTVTSPTASGPTRRRGGTTVQVARLQPSDTVSLRVFLGEAHLSLRCTRPARTLADLLRHLPVPDSVAIGDGAIRGGAVLLGAVHRELERQSRWPYIERARAAASLLDARRESWLESYSFAVLHLTGLPMPEPQVTISDAKGRFVARVDGWLADSAVALEADGKAKYLADLPALPTDIGAAADGVAAHVRSTVLRQNERQRRLESLGVAVVRWGTADIVGHPDAVAARISRAVRRQASRPFTGRAQLCTPLPAAG